MTLSKEQLEILEKNVERDRRKISEYVYYNNGGIRPIVPLNRGVLE